ncbi:hypothetical protein D4764_01G0013500 [Takifugu flavidus]|uniref:Secreted protein n=1 Tax=Takifugu flavidus TaxID=433684 RepID=A0A5C6PPY1_9TELE|nr:hypothetical protein D4764_01G0013500 [Takifugu flavidus]
MLLPLLCVCLHSLFSTCAAATAARAEGQRGGDEMQLRDSQGKHFDSRCSFAAFHFLALTSTGGLSSDKSQDQSDTPQTNDNVAKTPRSKTSSRFPRLGRSRNQEARPEPQSGDL